MKIITQGSDSNTSIRPANEKTFNCKDIPVWFANVLVAHGSLTRVPQLERTAKKLSEESGFLFGCVS